MTSNEHRLITARMAMEYAYCPRLSYLIYVDGKWEDNYYTEHGKSIHSHLDENEDILPDPNDPNLANDEEPTLTQSPMLYSESLGICAKPDIVETQNRVAIPVEFKRGKVPQVPSNCYEPERIQLMFQALLLRAYAYTCNQAMIYYASSKKRIMVDLTSDLEIKTHDIIARVRSMINDENTPIPPPLRNSPKCINCSLAPICLPDETLSLKEEAKPTNIRRLYPARDDALPLYIVQKWAKVGISGDSLKIKQAEKELGTFPLKDVSQLVLCGNISLTTPCIFKLCEKNIPIIYCSGSHRFYGITLGMGQKNAYDRAAQFAVSADRQRCLTLAKSFIRAKCHNQRTLLRRNAHNLSKTTLQRMKQLIESIDHITSIESLLGLEGSIAAIYFENFNAMLKEENHNTIFNIHERNRRPPRDPINAMLSLGYALLTKELTLAIASEALDPWWGFMHRPKHGKPALALDLIEEFRPLIVDSTVLTVINTARVKPSDFHISTNGCTMKDSAIKAFIYAYEQRLDQLITHPVFNYRCSWRSIIRIQVRLLSKVLRGELPEYTGIMTR